MLVTVERAKAHEYITHSAFDAEIAAKVAEASDIVLDYIGDRANVAAWDETTTPGVISAATLLVFGALWEGREGGADSPEPISETVQRLLRRYRDPPLA